MPVSVLDPVAALIVIDLQKFVRGIKTAHPIADVIARSAKLAEAFRERGLPVVLVNVTGGAPGRTEAPKVKHELPDDWTELVPELGPARGDLLVSKQRPGAFIGTSLQVTLRELGVTQVFITGVATSNGVEATARSAYDCGYNVVTVVDAMTDREEAAHRYCVEVVFPRIGETCGAEEVLELLGG
jgi:nicotinamidase-related amidase